MEAVSEHIRVPGDRMLAPHAEPFLHNEQRQALIGTIRVNMGGVAGLTCSSAPGLDPDILKSRR